MKFANFFLGLLILHVSLKGMQDDFWRVNQSGVLSNLSIRPIADSAYAIPVAPVQTLWNLSNAPRISFVDSLAAQIAEPKIKIEPSKLNTEARVDHIPLVSIPMVSSHMQAVFESTLIYQPASYRQAQNQFLSKHLHYLAQYPGGFQVYRARAAVIKHELAQAISVMRQATTRIADNPENAAVFESWVKLNTMILSVPELNQKFKERVAQIQEATVDSKSRAYNPALSELAINRAQKIVDQFEMDMKSWMENGNQLSQQCADDAEKFLRKQYPQGPPPLVSNLEARSNSLHAQQINAWNFLKGAVQSTDPEFTKNLKNTRPFQDLLRLVQLCNAGNLGQAYKIVSKYCNGNNLISIPFRCIYSNRFAQACTPEGVDKSLASNDPLYQQIKAEFLVSQDALPQVHPKNGELGMRKQEYGALKQFLSITKTNDKIDQIIYKMIDLKISRWDACGDFLNSLNLVSDSTDHLIKEACVQLYENGLLKGVCNPKQNQICAMPSKIDTAAHTRERALLWNLVKCSAECPSKLEEIKLAANYLQRGLNEGSSSYLSLAHAMGNALKNSAHDQRVLQLADYTKVLNNSTQTHIQEAAVRSIASNLVISNWDEISKVDEAYRAMLLGDIRGEFYLKQAFGESVNSCVFSQTYDAPMPHFDGVQASAVVAHVQEDKNTTRVQLQNGAELNLKRYEMPHSVTEFLLKNGLDPQKYSLLTGTIAQHANHTDILKQITKQHDLSGLQLIDSSNLHQLLKLSTQVTDLSREFNVAGDIAQSSVMSHFGWQMIGYIENAAKFGIDTGCSIGLGTYEGLRNFVHAATHPQEIVLAYRDLVLGMLKVMFVNGVLEEKLSILKSPEENEQIIKEFTQEFQPIFHAIEERIANATFQDVVREGTAFTVDFLTTRRAFAKIGEIAKITKLHGEQLALWIAENTRIEETFATTAEGIKLRVAAGTQIGENALLRKSIQTAGIRGREVILPKVQTYEQARNKALEIIGHVDPLVGKPHIGNVGVGEGKIVGRRWYGHKVILRLDWDPVKGPHINVTDYRPGKSIAGNVFTIQFEGDLKTVETY